MRHIIFYTKEKCPLCDDVRAMLELIRYDCPFEIEERNIYEKDEWLEKYQLQIPVVEINDTSLNCEQISYEALNQALRGTS